MSSVWENHFESNQGSNATAKEKKEGYMVQVENIVLRRLAFAVNYLDPYLPRSRCCQGHRRFSVDPMLVIAMLGKSDINSVWAQVRIVGLGPLPLFGWC